MRRDYEEGTEVPYTAWEAVLGKQADDKIAEEEKLQQERDALTAEVQAEWSERSQFHKLDDSVTASLWKGKSLKVIVKVRHHLIYRLPVLIR